MSLADEIEKLDRLKQSGSLSEEEYQKAKASVLRQNEPVGEKLSQAMNSLSSNQNTWVMLIHLSQLLAYPLPVVGYAVPIVLWQVKKNESDLIDRHGRIAANWIISLLIYMLISWVLILAVVGWIFLLVLGLLGVLFPVIAAIKASNGETWHYPGSIRFFPVS